MLSVIQKPQEAPQTGATPRTSAQYLLCGQLDRQLQQKLATHRFFEPTVRDARLKLRDAYAGVLLSDYSLSLERNVETSLWNAVFYKPIQQFRERISAAKAAGAKGRDNLAKASKTFVSFIEDASVFYRGLAYKLQAVCLVCLGDLARYAATVGLTAGEQPSYGPASKYYRTATEVYPDGGNAFNQIAVLAGLEGHFLAAVACYCRALQCKDAFTMARDNLILVLESSRKKYLALGSPLGVTEASRGSHAHLHPLADVLADLRPRFLRAMGILISHTDLDDFGKVFEGALQDLDDLLSRGKPVITGPVGKGPMRSDVTMTHLAVIALAAVHDPPSASSQGYAQAVQHALKQQHALDAVYALMTRLARGLATHGGDSPGGIAGSPLLPLFSSLLGWLASRREDLIRSTRGPPSSQGSTHAAALWPALSHLALVTAAAAEAAGIPFKHLSSPSDAHDSAVRDTQMGEAGNGSAENGVVPSTAGEECVRAALEEDRMWRGYAPMRAALKGVDFGKDAPAIAEQDQCTLRLQRVLLSLSSLVPLPYSPHSLPSAIAAYSHTISQLFTESSPAAEQPKAIEGGSTAHASVAATKGVEDEANANPFDEAMDMEEDIVYQPQGQPAADSHPLATTSLPTPGLQGSKDPEGSEAPHPPQQLPGQLPHLPPPPSADFARTPGAPGRRDGNARAVQIPSLQGLDAEQPAGGQYHLPSDLVSPLQPSPPRLHGASFLWGSHPPTDPPGSAPIGDRSNLTQQNGGASASAADEETRLLALKVASLDTLPPQAQISLARCRNSTKPDLVALDSTEVQETDLCDHGDMVHEANYSVMTVSKPLFIASEPFDGNRDGYEYKHGPQGAGGYLMTPSETETAESCTPPKAACTKEQHSKEAFKADVVDFFASMGLTHDRLADPGCDDVPCENILCAESGSSEASDDAGPGNEASVIDPNTTEGKKALWQMMQTLSEQAGGNDSPNLLQSDAVSAVAEDQKSSTRVVPAVCSA
ncbi:hypothetical protein WJX73_000102 [Symbiochloris irregularis]|uniref:Protein SMG7 n=1 Tax=Symbiochloris irregularis TaxID=706552 RepID=A0AAW1PHL5_9CHLO